jgi:hypothetical protein
MLRPPPRRCFWSWLPLRRAAKPTRPSGARRVRRRSARPRPKRPLARLAPFRGFAADLSTLAVFCRRRFCVYAIAASFNAPTVPAVSFGMEAGPCVQCLGRAARAHPPKEARSLRAATSRGCSAHIRALARRSSTSANASRARRPTEALVFASSASLPCAPGPKPVRRLSNPVTTEGRLIQPQKRAPIRAPIPTPTPAMTTAEKPTRPPAMLARTSRGRSLARRTR